MTSLRQSLLPNLLLSIGVSMLFLGSLEGICRMLERVSPPPRVAFYLWDWEERWDGDFYTIGPPGVGWPPWEDVNGDGLRDRWHPVEKLGGTRRVVFLGDSVTMGAGLKAHQAYPRVLEARLEERGSRVEVFNVALWGWSARQERIAYQRIARRYRPDAVVLAVCLNDIPELQNNLSRPPELVSDLHRRSALVRRLVNASGREIHSVEELFREKGSKKVRQGFERFFEEARALRREVEADGASFSLLVFPFRFQIEESAPPPSPQETILGFCRDQALRCVDLLPRLRREGPQAFLDYDHLSVAGARAVADEILSRGLLPEGAPAPAPEAGASTVAALVEALRKDPSPDVRAASATALGARGRDARAALPTLFAALRDRSETVRHRAAQALWKMEPSAPEDVPRLAEVLTSSDPYVRGFAAWTLGNLGPAAKDAVPALVAALEAEEGYGRGGAALALAKMGAVARDAVPALIRGLASEDHQRRRNAARALGKIGPEAKDAVPVLIEALEDPDARVRAQAARALGRMGAAAKDAVPALRSASREEDRAVRREAEGALRRIAAR